MKLAVSVIGPEDLVKDVCSLQAEFELLSLRPLPYEGEEQAVLLARAAQQSSDVLLFTGPVPFYLAKASIGPTKPWFFVSHRGASLLRALLQLAESRVNIRTLSLDTFGRAVVDEVYQELGLDSSGLYTRDYEGPIKSEDLVDFHTRLHSDGKTNYAVTCLRSAYNALQERGVPVIRVAPTKSSIRTSLRLCAAIGESTRNKASQVTIGILKIGWEGTERARSYTQLDVDRIRLAVHQRLLALGEKMQASVLFLGGDEFAIVATRGALEEATEHFHNMAFLSEIHALHGIDVSLGWGLGVTASQADHNARQSLRQVVSSGGNCCYILTEDQRMLGPYGKSGRASLEYSIRNESEDILRIAREAKLGSTTVTKLQSLMTSLRQEDLTANDLAQGFDISLRSARRILSQLQEAGFAQVVGEENPVGRGRPRQVYAIRLGSVGKGKG